MDFVIDKYWHPTGQPWFKGDDIGTGILAGSEDPHAAIWVADLSDMAEHLQDHEPMLQTEARDHVLELVTHIIDTHNAWLDAKKDAHRALGTQSTLTPGYMTEETELIRAARAVVADMTSYTQDAGISAVPRHAIRTELIQALGAVLPPEPIQHRCVRTGCEGIPHADVDNDGYVIFCLECGIRTASYAEDTEYLAWCQWYQNETGLPSST